MKQSNSTLATTLLILALVFSVGGAVYIVFFSKGAIFTLAGLVLGAIAYKKGAHKTLATVAMVVGALGVLWAVFEPVVSK